MNVYIQTCLSEKISLQTLQTNFGKHFLLVHISHQVLYLCLFSFLFSFLWTPLLVWCFSDLYMDTGSFWLMTQFCTKMSQQLTTIVCQTLSAKKKKIMIIIITVLKNVKLLQICILYNFFLFKTFPCCNLLNI